MKVSRLVRNTVLLNCAVPALLLGWDALNGHLGANPVNFAIRTTGILALIFLCLTLLVTPVVRLSGWGDLGEFRRIFGLCAFFYAVAHFAIFFGFDRSASVSSTLSEIVKRPYLMVGTFALVAMIPLAATSTNAMIRRLGGARWKALHRLTYLIAIAGSLHFYMLVKADVRRPVAFAAVVGLLLAYRVAAHYLGLRSAYNKLLSAASATSPTNATATRPRFWTGKMRVARIFDETPEVRTFRLVPGDSTRLPFDFLPGQYLNLSIPIDGKRVNRSYTIASAPTRQGYCEITVKREPQGVSSRHLHDTITEGSLLDISAPAGRFTFLGTEAGDLVMIAGGVGITPMMAKIRYLTDIGWPGQMHLILAVRSERDIIFRDELQGLERRFSNLRVTVILSREEGAEWRGERGRISPEFLGRIVPDLPSKRVHVCGPGEMMDATVAMLRDLGVPEAQIHLESFIRAGRDGMNGSGPAMERITPGFEPLEETNGAASITFARSGKSKPMDRKQTVLEASEDLGVEIPFDCRAGICGQCKTRVVSGHVVMDTDEALDASERASGLILSCQAHCVDQVVVEA